MSGLFGLQSYWVISQQEQEPYKESPQKSGSSDVFFKPRLGRRVLGWGLCLLYRSVFPVENSNELELVPRKAPASSGVWLLPPRGTAGDACTLPAAGPGASRAPAARWGGSFILLLSKATYLYCVLTYIPSLFLLLFETSCSSWQKAMTKILTITTPRH